MMNNEKTNNNGPPYSVPSMREIAAIPRSGFSVASTFSGAGGSCLGYRMAGFDVKWANEMEPHAIAIYRANHPRTLLDMRNIRDIKPNEILLALKIKSGDLDLLDGSPPCQSFSTAGKREKGWGATIVHNDGTTQRSDDLFFEYARLLRDLQPKVFVAENVSGLIKGTAKGYFKLIMTELKSCGYIVEARLLDAQWLGVPQARQRVIFIGIRSDLHEKYDIKPEFPAPLSYRYSVLDAIGDLLEKTERPERPSPTITSHICAETGFNPPPNIVNSEIKNRKFTIAELKRICSFPDDFQLDGPYAKQWARLGNSVPPLMMRAIAEMIRDKILARLPRDSIQNRSILSRQLQI